MGSKVVQDTTHLVPLPTKPKSEVILLGSYKSAGNLQGTRQEGEGTTKEYRKAECKAG